MNKQKNNTLKDDALEVLGIGAGLAFANLFLAIGISLCIGDNWIGILPFILGYELSRYIFIAILKYKIKLISIS